MTKNQVVARTAQNIGMTPLPKIDYRMWLIGQVIGGTAVDAQTGAKAAIAIADAILEELAWETLPE